jgi:hypothetical protein
MHEYTHTHRNICKCMHAYIHTKPRRRAEESGHTRADGGAKCAGGNTRSPFRHPICIHTGIYHTAGGGWGPGHGGTAQPIACAPSALARAQAPEPLVRVLQSRAHRARRAAPAHGGAPRAAGAAPPRCARASCGRKHRWPRRPAPLPWLLRKHRWPRRPAPLPTLRPRLLPPVAHRGKWRRERSRRGQVRVL